MSHAASPTANLPEFHILTPTQVSLLHVTEPSERSVPKHPPLPQDRSVFFLS